ncbi:TPA: DNA cytosine methyltransferase [Morganella morganii]|uniref:DNA cytosine methyltransferase n=1 Tax=Pectobacterium sp. HCp5_1 TaxID=3062446 RepID=UPI00293BA359|nr:DNA cytosine methyltransferase [Pectobacterium sp. HCp5_1]HCR3333864.1 DNA cytosine methyltransferase [Morganella morganii]
MNKLNMLKRNKFEPICFNEKGKMKYLSFFSGALGLDLGLESMGFVPLLYCEMDKSCRETIKTNRPDVPLIDDIRKYKAIDIVEKIKNKKHDDIDLIVGGPPCQAFSTAGARRSFEDDRGNVFLHFLEICMELNPKFIVIENVRGLLSASYNPSNKEDEKGKKGTALDHILNYLESNGYGVSFNLYNAANYGVPQIRERVVIIASRDGKKLPYLSPTHSQDDSFGLPKWNTLISAISDIPKERNELCAKFPENRLRYYKILKSGENWRNLPEELQKEALGKSYYLGGGKTGFLRRLDWNKPSPTLVTSPTMPATDLAHPDDDRPLSVAEYARIQQFPDDWIFAGSLVNKYKQIGNAVPCGLGQAIAKTIINYEKNTNKKPPENFKFSRYKYTTELDWKKAFRD